MSDKRLKDHPFVASTIARIDQKRTRFAKDYDMVWSAADFLQSALKAYPDLTWEKAEEYTIKFDGKVFLHLFNLALLGLHAIAETQQGLDQAE